MQRMNRCAPDTPRRITRHMLRGSYVSETDKGVKRQRSVLLDTLKNLHAQFESEFPSISLSYSLFCRLRPFHVQQPTTHDRESCLCKLHENASFLFDRLKQLSLLPPDVNNMDDCLQKMVCSTEDACYLRQCVRCKSRLLRTGRY